MSRRQRSRWVSIAGGVGVAAVCVGLAACGSSSGGKAGASSASASGAATVTVRVGIISQDPSYWAIYGADALGYTKAAHVKLDVIRISQEQDCVRGMIGGGIDACPVGLDVVAAANKTGANLRIVATDQDPTINTLSVNPKIVKTWNDLKGKSIAVSTPTAGSSVAIRALLQAHGISPSQVTFVTVGGSSARFAAMKAGKTAAAITAMPAQFDAAAAGFPTLGESISGSPIADWLAARPNLTGARKAAVTRLITAMGRADQWVSDPKNKASAIKLFESTFKVSATDAAASYNLAVTQAKSWRLGTSISTASVDRVATLIRTYTPLKLSTDDARKLIDNEYSSS